MSHQNWIPWHVRDIKNWEKNYFVTFVPRLNDVDWTQRVGDDEESDGKRREKRHAIKQHIRRKMCASLTFRISQKLFALKIVFSIVKGGDELRQQNNVIGRQVSK